MTQRKLFQAAMAFLALIPLATGVLSMMGVADPLYAAMNVPHEPTLDSNMRFFGGVWLGLGVAVVWLIPRIEQQTALFRALWGMIFVGGVGRLLSMAALGLPLAPFIGVTVLEIVGAPLFVWWHSRVVASSLKA